MPTRGLQAWGWTCARRGWGEVSVVEASMSSYNLQRMESICPRAGTAAEDRANPHRRSTPAKHILELPMVTRKQERNCRNLSETYVFLKGHKKRAGYRPSKNRPQKYREVYSPR